MYPLLSARLGEALDATRIWQSSRDPAAAAKCSGRTPAGPSCCTAAARPAGPNTSRSRAITRPASGGAEDARKWSTVHPETSSCMACLQRPDSELGTTGDVASCDGASMSKSKAAPVSPPQQQVMRTLHLVSSRISGLALNSIRARNSSAYPASAARCKHVLPPGPCQSMPAPRSANHPRAIRMSSIVHPSAEDSPASSSPSLLESQLVTATSGTGPARQAWASTKLYSKVRPSWIK
mmetsp:Transcript_91040/g.243722  ORF Transcript_91040/g.243722 Transcript_91040/m.243722 type:complete len:237 (-) Transcript_91040:387-1097(-)